MAWAAEKKCYPQMHVCAARVCELDLDGSTHISSNSSYATAATVSLGITPVYEDGAETKEKDGCGRTFVAATSDPALLRYDIDLDFWSTDATLLARLIPDGRALTGVDSQVGFAFPKPGTIAGQFSLEFWQKIINEGTPDSDFPYAHWALPYLKNVRMQKRDVNGTGVSHTILKAEGYSNDNWRNGPGDEWATLGLNTSPGEDTSFPVFYLPVDEDDLPTMNCVAAAIAS